MREVIMSVMQPMSVEWVGASGDDDGDRGD